MARGGKREGAGRKPIAEELKARDTFLKAIKEFYKKETCEEAQIQFIKETLMDSQRGQIFIAEHIFGKPEEEEDAAEDSEKNASAAAELTE